MRARWMSTALLSAALAAGCSNPPQAEEATLAPPADGAAPAEAAAPAEPAAAPAAPAKRSVAPARPAAPRPAPAAAAAPVAPAAPRVEYRSLTVPAGTSLPLELLTPLSTETAKVEAPVRARLKQSVSADGVAVLPAGTELTGTVTDAQGSGRVKGRARLAFTFTEAVVGGAREALRTEPVTFEAKSTKGQDAAKIGVGAGIGAAIGAIAGGGSGAAKGAAIGGGAGTGLVLATKGEEVELEAGTDLTATLADAYETRVRLK